MSVSIWSHHSEGLDANSDLRKLHLNERERFDRVDSLPRVEE